MPHSTPRSPGDEGALQLAGASILVFGDILLDAANFRVTRGIREVRVGPTEFRLLAVLMTNAGRVLSRDQLQRAAWPEAAAVNRRTVDVYIGRLRRALNRGRDRDPIRTVRHAGYVFGQRLPNEK